MTVPVSPSEKKTSPWLWVGLGCGGAAVVCLVVVAIGAFFVYGRMKNFGKQFQDPAVREERVRDLMGAREIPEGYHAFMTFSIPWVMDLAILSDREFVKRPKGSRDGAFDKWGFIYVRVPIKKAGGRNWEEFLEGKRSPDEFLKSGDVRFHQRDKIGRGVIQGDDGTKYHYVATRGEVEISRERKEGIITLIGVECPNDEKLRLGIWFGPDPTEKSSDAATEAPDGAGSEERTPSEGSKATGGDALPDGSARPDEMGRAAAVFAGTNADESEIKTFMAHFSLCQ